jgi:hypothetical protein
VIEDINSQQTVQVPRKELLRLLEKTHFSMAQQDVRPGIGCACGRPHPRDFLIGIRRSEVCLHLAQLLTAAPFAESRCHANTNQVTEARANRTN